MIEPKPLSTKNLLLVCKIQTECFLIRPIKRKRLVLKRYHPEFRLNNPKM